MKVINLQNYGVIVFNTKLTKEAILKLSRHCPNALKLKDAEGNDVFGLSFGESASISDYGICFNKVDNEGQALVTITGSLDNNEIADRYAGILIKARELETRALETYEALEADLLEIANAIENPTEVPEEVGEAND
jgi:hypothetical protein